MCNTKCCCFVVKCAKCVCNLHICNSMIIYFHNHDIGSWMAVSLKNTNKTDLKFATKITSLHKRFTHDINLLLLFIVTIIIESVIIFVISYHVTYKFLFQFYFRFLFNNSLFPLLLYIIIIILSRKYLYSLHNTFC